MRGGHGSGLADRSVGSLERIGEDELRAVRGQDRPALGRGLRGHTELDRESQHAAEHRVGDPGVPGGRLEDRLARRQEAARDPVEQHRAGRTVLDAPARVLVLGLGVETQARHLRRHARELQKRRVADSIEQFHEP
jgi:hypothetical protein